IAAFASTHLLVATEGGALLSSLDPPAWAVAESQRCTNEGVYPVLVGPPGSDDLLLAAPFILYDHPQIAPECAGDFWDATEIEELLALRTRLLTDDEKREARATDRHAAAIVDRSDAMTPEMLARMHGTGRSIAAGEMIPSAKPGA